MRFDDECVEHCCVLATRGSQRNCEPVYGSSLWESLASQLRVPEDAKPLRLGEATDYAVRVVDQDGTSTDHSASLLCDERLPHTGWCATGTEILADTAPPPCSGSFRSLFLVLRPNTTKLQLLVSGTVVWELTRPAEPIRSATEPTVSSSTYRGRNRSCSARCRRSSRATRREAQ